jgi:hypothetical protein
MRLAAEIGCCQHSRAKTLHRTSVTEVDCSRPPRSHENSILENSKHTRIRVARWFVFKPKIQIWVTFGVPWIGKCWYVLWPFGIFHDLLVHFVFIWYIFPVLASCSKKNLATLSLGYKKAFFRSYSVMSGALPSLKFRN